MQLEFFDHNRMQWDTFRQFYCTYGRRGLTYAHHTYSAPIVGFMSGEMVVLRCAKAHEHRGEYNARNIAIVSTAATDLKFATETHEPIAKTWLSHKGQQHLLIDYDFGIAVGLGSDLKCPVIPKWLEKHPVVAYYPGPGEKPQGAEIKVTRPDTDPARKAHVRDLLDACRAWWATVQDTPHGKALRRAAPRENRSSRHRPEPYTCTDWDGTTIDQPVPDIQARSFGVLVEKQFADIDPITAMRLVTEGWVKDTNLVTTHHAYLNLVTKE